jgi:hypothetical protein
VSENNLWFSCEKRKTERSTVSSSKSNNDDAFQDGIEFGFIESPQSYTARTTSDSDSGLETAAAAAATVAGAYLSTSLRSWSGIDPPCRNENM